MTWPYAEERVEDVDVVVAAAAPGPLRLRS